MAEKTLAFIKGGCGGLIAFIIIGLLIVFIGGRMHIDTGGAILLFLIGGIIGLLVLRAYKKGYKKGREASHPKGFLPIRRNYENEMRSGDKVEENESENNEH